MPPKYLHSGVFPLSHKWNVAGGDPGAGPQTSLFCGFSLVMMAVLIMPGPWAGMQTESCTSVGLMQARSQFCVAHMCEAAGELCRAEGFGMERGCDVHRARIGATCWVPLSGMYFFSLSPHASLSLEINFAITYLNIFSGFFWLRFGALSSVGPQKIHFP